MPGTDSHDGIAHRPAPPSPDATVFTGGVSSGAANVFQPGQIVGGSYQVLHALGQGAMGMVYKVKHVSMDVEYALKVLTTDYSNANAMLRFQNEAQALAKLNHPNVIAIYNFGLHEDRMPFYVMDFLSGEDLLDKLEAYGPMPVQVALPVFIEVCAGLSYAHRKGILHRDVKPANFVMLNAPDVRGARVKVVDFGLVKFSEEIRPDVQRLTAMGEVCGSPSYMSPEQTSGQKIDPRSDIYSLGCSLFQAVTGKLPYRGRTSTETMMMQHEAAVPTLASQGDGRAYPEDLERVVAKMMAKAPMDRYQTMESVAQDLRNIMEGNPLGTPASMPEFGTGSYKASVPSGKAGFTRATGAIAGGKMEHSQSFKRSDAADEQSSGEEMNMATTARMRKSEIKRPGKNKLVQNEDRGEPIPIKKVVAFALVGFLAVGLLCLGTYFTWRAMQPSPKNQLKVSSQTYSEPEQQSLKAMMPDLDPDAASVKKLVSSLKITQAKYYSSIVTEGGKQYIEFDFPKVEKGVSLGYIARSFSVKDNIDGKMRYPKGTPLWLAPMPVLAHIPHFFEKFQAGDFVGMFIPSGFASDEVFNLAAQVPGIRELTIDNSFELSNKIVPSLSTLPLEVFRANCCPINGSDLAKAHFWPNLKVLDISVDKNVTPVLKVLSGSTKLAVLGVAQDKLTSEDFELISTLSGLRRLNISNNRVSPRDIRALAKLPKLVELCAYNISMTDSAYVEELCKMRSLKSLGLCTGYMKAQDVARLKRRCPNLRVIELNSVSMKQMLMMGSSAE